MTRKLRRTSAFDLELVLKDDGFIAPPRARQRNWLLNRFIREAVADLEAADELARRFVPGAEDASVNDKREAELSEQEIMEDWQLPLMGAMAEVAGLEGGDVLEVGFGRGVASDLLQARGIGSHTVIECNPSVVRRFEQWRAGYPGRSITLVEGLWQDVMDGLGRFDSIFFHTYALDEEEAVERLSGVTFADNFFPVAARHLREGGRFTYLSNEMDSLGRTHQRLLLRHFREIRMRVVPLQLPRDVRDAWWADSMVVVEAVR
ncbi:MAG: class I SAM-dependent methyltransferase [Gemmatimonadota bacterium]|jgi:guanidinoacetate N-methyltransferase